MTRETFNMRRRIDEFDAVWAGAAKDRPAETHRVVPVNGGFELQEAALMMNGKWEYKRIAWSRNRKDVIDSARLRGVTIS